jgi:hypothetical protein
MHERHQARVQGSNHKPDRCYIVVVAGDGWDDRRWWNFQRGCWESREEIHEHLQEVYAPEAEARQVQGYAQDAWNALVALEVL